MNRRDEQIALIADQVEGLNPELLQSSKETIRSVYQATSIIDELAHVDEITDRTPSDFHVLTSQELRRIEHFNDASYSWDLYCREFGRSISLAEQRLFFEVLQEKAMDAEPTLGVGFYGINEVVRRLESEGYKPNLVLAPISYMIGFYNGPGRTDVEYADNGRQYLKSGNRRLRLIWSSQGKPLDRFIVMDTSVGIWQVKLDPATGTRLTVAIGIQVGPPRGVLWLAETVAKYEIKDRNGIRSFRPDETPDPNFDTVR